MTRRMLTLPVVVLLLLALAGGCTLGGEEAGESSGQGGANVAQRAPEPAAGISGDEPVAQVASQVGPSVVQVNVEAVQETPLGAQEQQGLGSGVIYREDGHVITNNHVVESASSVNIAFADGSIERGEVIGNDPATDLAVVKVERDGLPAARFRQNADLTPGQLAVAIGSPSGFQSTVTAGVISGLNRSLPPELTGGDNSLVDLIQTDAAISPGSSGGGLADRAGEIVGINVAYLPPAQTGAESIGFAIPSDTAISVADQLIEDGEATQPYLGVNLEEITPEDAEQFGIPVEGGVLVSEVVRGGPADEAGMEQGDVITAAGDAEVATYGDLLGALRDYRPGDNISLAVVRDGEERRFEIELGERPQG
ncbi:MAG: Serine protease precursor MucD/AlgY associated with sigma factor RpoE [uncultured Rubrobacteraceae bacterium]|uniref:Serine protease MucD/AlgY associated with sigma factor RpoE n=1 Tax=uncultured Rubrobacteraceae bacterium TaxID=349277 RepID=A0A6J4S162_9ACTN|nr:MAG: Serine protease precursor MucD/AlgY associated with sigma factor RpoE [uncultured Rubrobacteraceae bacterium]